MSVIINVLDYLIMVRFFSGFLGGRRKHSRLFFLIYSILVIGFISAVNELQNPIFNLGFLIIYVAATVQFFKGNAANKMITVLLYLGFGLIAEVLVMWCIGYYENKFNPEVPVYVAMLLCEGIRYCFVSMLCAAKKEKSEELPKGTAAIMSTILLISLAGCLIIEFETVESSQSLLGALVILLTFMIIHFLMFTLFEKFHSVTRVAHEKEMILQEAMLKESYYREVDENNEKMNKLKHDLKNRLTPLCDLTEAELLEARKTIQEICEEMKQTDGSIYCRNKAVNAICKDKLDRAKKKDIQVKCSIRLPDNMDISYGDLGILYGNLLDNAIEACGRMKAGTRFISLYTELNGRSLVVTVENSKDSRESLVGKTVKQDKRGHGIGLKSVKRIVDKYEGIMEKEDLGSRFRIQIVMYNIGSIV